MKLFATLTIAFFTFVITPAWSQSDEVETHSSMNLPKVEMPDVDSIVASAMELAEIKIEMDEMDFDFNIDLAEMMRDLNVQLKEMNIVLKRELQNMEINHGKDCKEMPDMDRPRKMRKLRDRKSIKNREKRIRKRQQKTWKRDAKSFAHGRKFKR